MQRPNVVNRTGTTRRPSRIDVPAVFDRRPDAPRATWWTAFVAVLAAVAGCAAPTTPERAAAPADEPTFRVISTPDDLHRFIQTDHFAIYPTDFDTKTIDGLVRTAEAAYAEYRKLVPDAAPLVDRIQVRMFRNHASALPYLRSILEAGDAEYSIRSGGFVVPHFGIVVINPAVDAARSNLAHEGFHAFAQETFAWRVPAFIEEGIASSFEGVQLIDERTIVFQPKRHPKREAQLYTTMRSDAWLPLDRLFALNAADYLRERPGDADAFYAHAWAFALYLDTVDCAGRSGTSALRAMLSDAATGNHRPDGANSRDAWSVVVHYSGQSREQIEAGFRRFVTQVIAPRGAPVN